MRIYIRQPSIFGWYLLVGVGIYLAGCGAFFHWPMWLAIPIGLGCVLCTLAASDAEAKEKIKKEIKTGRDAYISRLKNGEIVSFRSRGNSMTPRIRSGDTCTYTPVTSIIDVSKNDMVYCHCKGRYFTHLVTAIRGSGENTEYLISNNHGHDNGWISLDKIYGKVVAVNNKPVK